MTKPNPPTSPQTPADTAPECPQCDGPVDPSCGCRRALVVDDEPTIRLVLKRTLEEAGIEVVTADNGAKAISHLAEERFDVVVTDLIMPDMDGVALVKVLRRCAPDMPIIVITGDPRYAAADSANKLGVEACLPKPFGPELFTDAVLRVIDQPSRPTHIEG